jgi:hypothetical protein
MGRAPMRSSGVDPFSNPPEKLADGVVAELYRLILQMPSLLGRLTYIADRWNTQTGRYDRELPERFQDPLVYPAIASWHRAFFIEWLSLPLEKKEADVSAYWLSMGGKEEQLKKLVRLGEAAIPPLMRAVERQFFVSELGFIQALLLHQHTGGAPIQVPDK